MNRFYVIGLDDNMRQYFPPEILEIISSHRVFSGGVRHHEIVRSLLPEKADWIDIKVPLDEVSSLSFVRPVGKSIVVFASRRTFVFRDRRYDSKPIAGCANPPVTRHLIPCNSWHKSIDALPRYADRLPYRTALARVRSCLDRKCV